MSIITVVCREDGYPNDVLIYVVDADPNYEDAVQAAVQAERRADIGDEANEMVVLFAFTGDQSLVADWRD